MKRFYKAAQAVEVPGGWAVALDGKPIRTPARAPFRAPTRAAAEAAAAEWEAQAEEIAPAEMPVNRALNTAIDQTAVQFGAVAEAVAAYAGTDLLCYRAETPEALAAEQAAAWDPLLAWAEARHGARLTVAAGVMHVAQPEVATAALSEAVRAYGPEGLTALSDLTALAGSLVLGLAVAEGEMTAEAGWAASRIDESWQERHWGVDAEAARMAEVKRRDFHAAARLIDLLGPAARRV